MHIQPAPALPEQAESVFLLHRKPVWFPGTLGVAAEHTVAGALRSGDLRCPPGIPPEG